MAEKNKKSRKVSLKNVKKMQSNPKKKAQGLTKRKLSKKEIIKRQPHIKQALRAKQAKHADDYKSKGIAKKQGVQKHETSTKEQRQAYTKKTTPEQDHAAEKQRKTKEAKALAEEQYTVKATEYINLLVNNEDIANYLNKNVSRRAPDVLQLLNVPRTDEEIAATLDLKINAVRRILNIMQGYGITNYNISKNVDGWLSFAWYINANKIPQFLDYVKNINNNASILKDDCNDYFICDRCYAENKYIFTFDAAYEAEFKCNICKKPLTRIEKSKANELINAPSKQLHALPEK